MLEVLLRVAFIICLLFRYVSNVLVYESVSCSSDEVVITDIYMNRKGYESVN